MATDKWHPLGSSDKPLTADFANVLTREPYSRSGNPEWVEMNLPDGKTCQDCRHFYRCYKIFGHEALDETCDWSPSKFQPRKEAPDGQ